jgi:pyruvate,water dikinase
MKWMIPAAEVEPSDRPKVGGKGYSLALMTGGGFNVPQTLCVTAQAYQEYIDRTGLRERILLELHRKDFNEMRWEEIWDCATRIRNMFLRKPIPASIEADLREAIASQFKDKPVAVRSSAPDEDSAQASFAGLHESYLNVKGTDEILAHIRKVWASLWSDAALLYRQEIGLVLEKSAMAVVIQELVAGDRSGVTFTQNPTDTSQGVIESVHGLNQGLVDGAVEPDRWILDRRQRTVITHTPVSRKYWMVPYEDGVRLSPLPDDVSHRPPISLQEARTVFDTAMQAEEIFRTPQDVEWTFRDEQLFLLQARPITTVAAEKSEDNRSWYLSLHRKRIEEEFIPGMIAAADQMAAMDLTQLSDQALAQEIQTRWGINHKWVNIYWEEFIPFAHGVRLFGQVYNDAIQPEDPYEFVDLLTQTDMASLERNRMLENFADQIRNDHRLAEQLKSSDDAEMDPQFLSRVEDFIHKFGDLSCSVTGGTRCVQDARPLFKILLEMAAHPPLSPADRKSNNADHLKEKFLSCFEGEQRVRSEELLDLARSSYQLRDDDNIHLGRIEAQALVAVQEGKRRIQEQERRRDEASVSKALKDVLFDVDHGSKTLNPYRQKPGQSFEIKPRQLTGQPAGPGIARGRARVIQQHDDLSDFKFGEVLICDAVDPNMTFVVPLASAVVERRGGMLIHGAIIAREYGLPCVTGISDATALIQTGDEITVDGYLGIVTVGSTDL